MDDLIIFVSMSLLCFGVWAFIAHIDTYIGMRKRVKSECLEDFTFLKYSSSEVKRFFTGKGSL